MSKGKSNLKIENAIKNVGVDDSDDHFVVVFPSNHMNKVINHAAVISEEKGKYSFVIANTDSSEEGRTHWWSILDIEPKTDIFFFDSFGLDGLKHFIIQYNRQVIEKTLFGMEKMARTASNFFPFIQAFGNKLTVHNFVNIWMVEDKVQNFYSVTCGIVQLLPLLITFTTIFLTRTKKVR